MNVSLVSFGGGTDSTAMLIEMINRDEPPPHAILFADTGGEHPHTYRHIEAFSAWLVERSYPAITIVRVVSQTLEEMCLRLKVLPSIAYGWKTCSQRFKVEPQEKWANNDPACRAEWDAERLVTRVIGYEYGEERRVRESDAKYANRYPLIEWEIDRDACKAIIIKAGFARPGKSSCFFCPSMTKPEIKALANKYPDLRDRALAVESNAEGMTAVVGLGRRFRWQDYLAGLDTAPELPMDMPCDCYDGAADEVGEQVRGIKRASNNPTTEGENRE